MKQKRRLLSLLVTLAVVIGLMPGLSLTALATTSSHTHEGWTEWDNTTSLPAEPGSYFLTQDVTLNETWSVPGTVNLCLNGHKIDGNNKDFSVITVPTGATLNLYDCQETPGTITGGKGTTGTTDQHDYKRGGGVLVQGTFNMYGGSISGNILNFDYGSNGGGVAIDNGGTFKMSGGKITGNKVKTSNNANQRGVGHGSAVLVAAGGTFEMSGGKISGNNGVHGAVSLLGNATANITGGTFQANDENQAIHTNGTDGAFNLTISGGTISGGASNKYAITIQGKETDDHSQFTLSGDPKISGTILLGKNPKLTINDYEGDKIPVYGDDAGVFTSGCEFANEAAAQKVFESANPKFTIGAENGQAKLYQEPVPYMAWDETEEKLVEKTCATYEVVTKDTKTLGKDGEETWYVVKDNVTIENQITLNGNVHLILCNGAKLNVSADPTGDNASVINGDSHNITIYAQSTDEETMGALNVTATGNAADGIKAHNVTIHGGKITAQGSGGNNSAICATLDVTIYGGEIDASGSGYGIYSGEKERNVTIYGGTVKATGSTYGIYTNNSDSTKLGVTVINGGDVTAISTGTGDNAKAINGTVKNAIPGTGWANAAGTENGTPIVVNEVGQTLDSYKKVRFLAPHIHTIGEGEAATTITFQPWDSATSLPNTAGNYFLTRNVTLKNTWTVPSGTTNLCLNGKTIRGDLIESSNHDSSVVYIAENSILNLYDDEKGAGKIVSEIYTYNGGTSDVMVCDVVIGMGGKFNMYGGTISATDGNQVQHGVYMYNGSFTMHDGRIQGASYSGVWMNSFGGTFTMEGGTITGNTATQGGGVHVEETATFIMKGGSITRNTAADKGGGVYVAVSEENEPGGVFTMNGGSITRNTAEKNGGGVYVEAGNKVELNGKFKISNAPEINGNTVNNLSDNVYLAENTVVNVADTLSNEKPIGIKMAVPGVFTSGNASGKIDKFVSNDTNYTVAVQGSELMLRLRPNYYITYKVNTEAPEHGTVTAKPTYAAKGRTVTVTAVPDEGYEVDAITVTDKKGNPVEVTKKEDGTYTFKMPASQVTVSAAFKKTEEPTPVEPKYDESHETCGQDTNCPMMNFTDLDMTEWYHDGVHFCLANGIMNGNGDGTFAPKRETTRAELVQILYNLEGRPMIRSGIPFTDVTEDDWFAMAVSWAESKGMINGNDDGTFEPDAPVTREQIAKILYGYAQFKGLDVSQGEDTNILDFTDAEEISDWAVPYVQWAVGAELMSGRDEGDKGFLLAPQESAERAEVATLMMRFCLSFLAE